MLWYMLTRLLSILYTNKKTPLSELNPRLLLVGLLVSWIGLSILHYPAILITYPYVLVLHVLHGRESVRIAGTVSLPVAIIGLVAGILSPFKPLSSDWAIYLGSVILRVYGIASSTLIIYTALGPLKLPGIFARASPLLHDILSLFYRLAPQAVEDALVALSAQRLMDRSTSEVLVAVTLSNIRKSEEMKVAYYMKGARPGMARTRLYDENIGFLDLLLLALSLMWILVFILY